MKNQQPEELINKYLSGNATADEKAKLESWYLVHSKNSKDVFADLEYPVVEQEMWLLIEKQLNPRQKQTRLWPRISIAAAVVLIASGLYFFNKTETVNVPQQASVTNDIPPGKNRATLTLANGKKIVLSDAKTGVTIDAGSLTYNDGSAISHADLNGDEAYSEEAVKMIASTPRGGQYQFTLSDGTKVWLNAESKLEFPSNFKNAKERIVKLEGEGYFEVAKLNNAAGRVPFIVQTDKQVVEVLGTHFNINSYSDEIGEKTTLLEGSVRASSTENNNQVLLKPNEQALVISSRSIAVKKVDIEDAVAWKNGDFIFDNDDLESIMRKIARWYDVEVYYPERPKKSLHFGGVVSRSRSISSVLNSIQSEGQVNFKLLGRKITVLQN